MTTKDMDAILKVAQTHNSNVAAEKGVCLSPGFLNDHNPEFAWTPFDCRESISCVLCTHRDDQRSIVREFVALLREHYSGRQE